MDIKDLILIGGGLLIAAVIGHGLWIAWRVRRDPLRLDIDEKLIAAVANRDPAEADFPNGGARVVAHDSDPLEQAPLAFEEAQPVAELPEAPLPARAAREPTLGPASLAARPGAAKTEPILGAAAGARGHDGARGRDTPGVTPRETPRDPLTATRAETARPEGRGIEVRVGEAPAGRASASRAAPPRRPAESARTPAQRPQGRQGPTGRGAPATPPPEAPQDELVVINILAPREQPFTGARLVEALRANGLRYGDMNIFHRLAPDARTQVYSVANIIEPGTFDMAEIEEIRSPGVCFFMRLPGPEQPVEALEDMLRAARDVAERLGGELKDERRSVLTGQTVEHYRHRVAEFCRRRMSLRA